MNQQVFTEVTEALANGGIVVVRTDTIYGIIALARNEEAVENVYATKRRDLSKQCIVLLADANEAPAHADMIAKYGGLDQPPTSVIVPATSEPEWLLRGGSTIAYRVTRNEFLNAVVRAVGPVIAPSANPEGLQPARTIEEAKAYFNDAVDVYVDGGEVPEAVHASRVIEVLPGGEVRVIRA